MPGICSFGFAVFLAVVTSAAAPLGSPTVSPTPLASPEAMANPNTTPVPAQAQQSVVMFDVKKLAATSRPAVALVTVLDKAGKRLGLATGFFVSPDGKLVTNAHVIEGADSASAKLENGATYSIRGVLNAAADKDLVLLQADAKDVPSLTVSREPSLPEIGSRVAVIGSPLGLEGTVSEGIISGHRSAKKDDQWLQMTAPVSPGSSGSPVVDENGKVVGIATFLVYNAQALNFARPVAYVSELLDKSQGTTEVAPFWTVAANPKNVVLNDPDFVAAENALQKDDAAGALKLLNGIAAKYPENEAFLFRLGAVYERLNLLDDAVQAYQHALKLEPTSGIGWTSLGSTFAKLKRFAEAEEAAKRAVKQSPDYGPAWALLGKLYSDESRYADAADAFQKAAQLMPKDAEFWRSLAESYSKMNEPAKSQEAIQKSQEITGNAPIARASPVLLERDRYTDLITVTLRATEQRDIDTLMSTYADKVVYRGYGVVDKPFIRKDLESYFLRWPVTKLQRNGAVRVLDTKKPDEKRLLFSYDFHATSPDRGAASIGSTSNEWWVWETQGALKVFGEKQKVTRGQKNRAEDQGLETFRLVGYNCSILVPKSIFPDPPVTEGKHTAFWSPDRKTKLDVFVQPQNSIPIAQAYRTYVAAGNLQPDYEVVRTNWFVVSGDKNGRGYYVKCVARNNLLLYMTLDYDEETFPFSDATLTAMSRNFLGK
jgi:S1-C subfamily serine protease/Tfp pilus assembly protein PilF